MALSAAVARRYRPWMSGSVISARVANGDTVYVGSFCGWPGANALTSRRGYLTTYRNQVSMIWAGLAIGATATNSLSVTNTVVGDTSASPVPEIAVEAGPFILEQYAVTGTSAQSDVARVAVYASDDNTLTTTASYAPAVGRVMYWYSSTTCDVLFYGFLAAIVI